MVSRIITKSYKDENENIIDEWGVGRKVIDGYAMLNYHPLAEAEIEDLDSYPWPVIPDEGRIRGLKERAEDWYNNTDYAITATSATSGTIFELCQYLRGTEGIPDGFLYGAGICTEADRESNG